MDVIDSLEETFNHAESVIANVRESQYADKTPCEEWTVRELLEHMVDVVVRIGAAASGQPSGPFVLAADPAAQFRGAAVAALAAWRTPGVLDRMLDAGPGPMPGCVLASINQFDTATHTWDLATATGQPAELPEPIAAAAMDASKAIVSPELRPGRFGPEQPAPGSASTTQRLVAFLGRSA